MSVIVLALIAMSMFMGVNVYKCLRSHQLWVNASMGMGVCVLTLLLCRWHSSAVGENCLGEKFVFTLTLSCVMGNLCRLSCRRSLAMVGVSMEIRGYKCWHRSDQGCADVNVSGFVGLGH